LSADFLGHASFVFAPAHTRLIAFARSLVGAEPLLIRPSPWRVAHYRQAEPVAARAALQAAAPRGLVKLNPPQMASAFPLWPAG